LCSLGGIGLRVGVPPERISDLAATEPGNGSCGHEFRVVQAQTPARLLRDEPRRPMVSGFRSRPLVT
jgi:hypothetical protein